MSTSFGKARRQELLTAAVMGPLGPPQLTCIRSWAAHGIRVVFVHVTDDDFSLPFSRNLVDVYLRLRDADLGSEEVGERICALFEEEAVDGVTAVSYSLAYYLHELRGRADWPAETAIWVQSVEALGFLESKVSQVTSAESCGLLVAPTAYFADSTEDEAIPFDFPWAVRPDSPADVKPSFKVEFIDSALQWDSFRRSRTAILKPLVIQPFIDGTNVVVHGVRSAINGSCMHSAFQVEHMIDGVTLTLTPTLVPEELVGACERFVEIARIVGVYHFEFRRSADGTRYYFLEINGRLGGTTGKVYRLGFDEPWSMVLAFGNQDLVRPQIDSRHIASNRIAIVKTIVRACRNRMGVFDYPEMSLYRRVVLLSRGLFSWRDEIFFVSCLRSSAIFLLDSVSRRLVSCLGRRT